MKTFKFALCQMNPIVSDLDYNINKIIEFTREASSAGADTIIFPEMITCGYLPEDLLLMPTYIRNVERKVSELKNQLPKDRLVILGSPVCRNKETYNSFVTIFNNKCSYIYDKTRLPNFGVFDEQRFFKPGQRLSCINKKGSKRPINFPITICRDIWEDDFVDSVINKFGRNSFMLNISASPYHRGKPQNVVKMLRSYSKKYKTCIIYCNLVGGQDELVFFGGSFVISKTGQTIMEAPLFREGIFYAEVDENGDATKHPSSRSNLIAKKTGVLEETYQLIKLGIKDFFRKTGHNKAVLGLSGGIDSALVCCLAADALGRENVTAISLPTRFTSKLSGRISQNIAKNLGIKLITINIDSILSSFLKSNLDIFSSDQITPVEENLQSRIRGNLLMSFSNKTGALMLATGNKSELATGYATLYGDLAGAFAPIKDLYKCDVYRLAKYYNDIHCNKVIPDECIRRVPTAELKSNQKDSDTLPPYEILDKILPKFIEERKDPNQIINEIKTNKETILKTVEMIKRSEFKRKQAPPGPKISGRSFGKDWRMPISSGPWWFL